MTTLRGYAALPAAAGSWFLVVGSLGRLPVAMLQIGSLLLVSTRTDSLAAGGAAAASLALGQAIGGPLVGRLADTVGHRPVGLATAALQVVAIVGLVAVTTSGAPLPAMLVSAFGVGVSVPQVGALARARWAGMVRGEDRTLGTAMSYEGVVDDATFVFGPALVGLVIAIASPYTAMLLAAALTGVFAVGFALHPSALRAAEDAHLGVRETRTTDLPSLWLLTALMFCVGMFFASIQAGVTATAVAAHAEASAGLIYAALGVTSAVAGLLTPALPQRFSLPARLVAFPLMLLLCLLPLLMLSRSGPTSLTVLLVAVLVIGAAVAPTLITCVSLGERTAPLARVSWAMTVLASGLVLGYGIAALLAGASAEAHGPIGAFSVTAAAATGAALIAFAGYRRFDLLRTSDGLADASSCR